jgi:hypothetical protein
MADRKLLTDEQVFGKVGKVMSDLDVFGSQLEGSPVLSDSEVFSIPLPESPSRAQLGQYVKARLDLIEKAVLEIIQAKRPKYVFTVERDDDGNIVTVTAEAKP